MFKLQEVKNIMSLRSSVFSDYFYKLMANHNIKSIRNGMKVLIFYFCCEIISSHMADRGIIFRPIIALISFCIYFIFFVGTVDVKETIIMVRLASVMVILSISYTVLLGTDTPQIVETHYSLSIVIILMMYTLFRFRFLITMLLSVVYILIFVTVGNYRMKYLLEVNVTTLDKAYFRAERYIFTKMRDTRTFLCGQCILFVLLFLTGCYLRFFNSIRRKSAFLKLAQNAKAKLKMQSAVKVQSYWIEAIMPDVVRDEFIKQFNNKDMFNLVYCKKFENVSILFADIVGFTNMSSNKTAEHLVYLLNDLYNRFDKHSKLTNCEKIGTLGDCYYCVSGCPVARPDHATCCVEMGLRICRIILKFNKDHKENVNMRVGVHSGRVIASIIGNQRFRFDVFSNDVIVANSLESSGKPGFVHISENTYQLVRHAYMFEDGDLLDIKKENNYGIGGYVQTLVPIKTYFVIPKSGRSILIQTPFNIFNRESVKESIFNKTKVIPKIHKGKGVSFPDTKELFLKDFQRNDNSANNDGKLEEDLNLIRVLEQDPERPVNIFQNPPVNNFLLFFNNKEIEHQYLYHTTDQVDILRLDSMKTALLFDSLACLIFTTTLFGTTLVMIPTDVAFQYHSSICYTLGVVLTIIALFISLFYKSQINNGFFRMIYTFFSHPISRLLLSISISSVPSLFVLSIYNPKKLYKNYQYTSTYFTLTLFALIGNSLSTTSYSIIKHISTAIFTVVAIIILSDPFSLTLLSPVYSSSCTTFNVDLTELEKNRLRCHFMFQLIHICLLIYYLNRENEKNIRINFYVSRESEIRNGEASRAKKIAESLLYNIIPKYVFGKIVGNDSGHMTFSYAHAIPKAGVVFACISNFFATYYREDYKSGEAALKLLHIIICTFDNLLQKPIYRSLEKIKTVNDCYMIASGLNTEIEKPESDDHLETLMNYALDIRYQLHLFNEKNIIGTNRFILKIGYNYGPVTAGIIGISKPLYDIWGDTVNVASRMYSTSSPGNIQVPDYVVKRLENKFEFKYRGKVPVKGKGEMTTYFVLRSYKIPHFYLNPLCSDSE